MCINNIYRLNAVPLAPKPDSFIRKVDFIIQYRMILCDTDKAILTVYKTNYRIIEFEPGGHQ